ncbi:putative glycosyl transferase, family 14 [Dioscorea sansibarensis]
MKQQQQQMQDLKQHATMLLISPNFKLLWVLSSLLLFGFGLALGSSLSTLYHSYVPFQTPSVSFPSSSPPPPPPPPSSMIIHDQHKPKEHVGLKEYIEPKEMMHDMNDDELLWRASMVPHKRVVPYERVPKLAFLFLTRGALTFAPLWEMFFKGHQGLYSIYVHADPSFSESTPKDSVFFGRRIPSKVVRWGEISMMEAERRLLANALLDFSNQRFILLSESCIPLFNFPTVYSYLINSTLSHVHSFDDPGPAGRGRYNKRMQPLVLPEQWRKGSQWFEMDRNLAIEIVSDNKFFMLFSKYCKPSCYADEHYLPTYVSMKFGGMNSNRSLTWVDWSYGGPHPVRVWRKSVTVEFLNTLRSASTCSYNGGNTTVCFLFARKFLPNTLWRLMKFAPKVMGFGP